MSASFRGLVDEYAAERDTTMPQAYKELIEAGLVATETNLEDIGDNLTLPDNIEVLSDDVEMVARLDDDEYEVIMKEKQ